MNIPTDCVAACDYQRHFRERVHPMVAAYIDGAAADGLTRADNRAAFDRVRLLPRVLTRLGGASAGRTLLGRRLDYPLIIAPMAFHHLVHPDGEIATAHAAGLAGTWMTVSTQASTPLEQVAAAASHPLWFQLYPMARPADTLALAIRAERAGYAALVLTVDAPVSGIRNEEQRAGFHLPPGISPVNLAGMAVPAPGAATAGSPVFQGMLDNAPTWDDVARLCAHTRLPVLLKGILNPADITPALAAGAAGIIVSNHGGRVLDSVPAALEMLPAIAAQVGGRVPVLVDGGIRRGTDIVKAIALGADAVMVGRPVLHALAVGGISGVAHLLTVLHTELEAAMALCGRATLADIDASLLAPRPAG